MVAIGPGLVPAPLTYAAFTPANCKLAGVAWWDGATYQANGSLASRADLTGAAQAMISAGGPAHQQTVTSADGAQWLLVYNPSNASVTVYRCTRQVQVYAQPYPYYRAFGPGIFPDGFRDGIGFGFDGIGFGRGFGGFGPGFGFGGGGFGGGGGHGGGGGGGGGGRMRGGPGEGGGLLGLLRKPVF